MGKSSRKTPDSPAPPGAELVAEAGRLAGAALDEDLGPGDLTSGACLPGNLTASASVVARQAGVVAGLWLVGMVYGRIDDQVQVGLSVADGRAVWPGEVLAEVRGPAASLLAGERTALNFLQHLGGIATLTAAFVEAVEGTRAVICDTRKTTPGWRRLEKYAVRCGGGTNHRMGLYDEVLIKDNHLALAGRGIVETVLEVRDRVGERVKIEVEVDTLGQLGQVLALPVDCILL
ncbi:MAG: carboxylating nicotinate-nucleotide diphosphorylase, partial [Anaerolineaceae bacterium]|nr:carboxylating nicotinate-nucleotide diphosphorylase [Anaerolineaceae bacterium]